jgi:hypothetical protein
VKRAASAGMASAVPFSDEGRTDRAWRRPLSSQLLAPLPQRRIRTGARPFSSRGGDAQGLALAYVAVVKSIRTRGRAALLALACGAVVLAAAPSSPARAQAPDCLVGAYTPTLPKKVHGGGSALCNLAPGEILFVRLRVRLQHRGDWTENWRTRRWAETTAQVAPEIMTLETRSRCAVGTWRSIARIWVRTGPEDPWESHSGIESVKLRVERCRSTFDR